jgi:integrase
MAVIQIKLYRRHVKSCKGNGKVEKDCGCSVWFQCWDASTSDHRRWSSKTSDYATAVELSHVQLAAIKDGGQPWLKGTNAAATVPVAASSAPEAIVAPSEAPAGSEAPLSTASSIARVVQAYILVKTKAKLAPDTLERIERTLERLEEYCNTHRITSIGALTSLNVSNWFVTWSVKSLHAQRNEATRAKGFFNYCYKHGLNANNLADTDELSVSVENNDEAVRPLSPAEYKKILSAINDTDMTPENKHRVRLCMRLQRESGLALVDAALLAKTELHKDDGFYTVKIVRQKTKKAGRKGSRVEVPISKALGDELMALETSNPAYFFWSGNTARRSDASDVFQKHYRRVAQAAKLDFSSHDLRHTFAVESLKAGVTLRKLSKALGHSSIGVTEDYYAKWSREEKEDLQDSLRESLSVQSATA